MTLRLLRSRAVALQAAGDEPMLGLDLGQLTRALGHMVEGVPSQNHASPGYCFPPRAVNEDRCLNSDIEADTSAVSCQWCP